MTYDLHVPCYIAGVTVWLVGVPHLITTGFEVPALLTSRDCSTVAAAPVHLP
jgi:hypothetical protein